jgi:tetratricopeptide (TPR) repeat protein/ABC-type iron transport system FetAB ATPase subunit
MATILEVLGRSEIADQLIGQLAEKKNCLITGASGTGKTELSRHIGHLWSRDKGETIWLIGDKDQAGTSYLAANRALAATRPRRAAREADRELPLASLRSIPWVGGPVSALAKSLVARLEPTGPDFLSSELQDLLSGFQRTFLTERLLFIVDNLHWLDPGTADLLVRIGTPEVAMCYSFVERSVFLFVETPNQESVQTSAPIIAALKRRVSYSVRLTYPSRDEFPDVLLSLGLVEKPEPELCDRLYDLTRGHLKLAREIVLLLQQDSPERIFAREHGISAATIADKLFQLRLDALQSNADDIAKLLGIASCIGQVFLRDELECAFSNPKRFLAMLDLARREEFLSGSGETLQFAHEVIQSALQLRVGDDAPDYHDKLAECLRHIRPGDYVERLRHSIRANDRSRTASLALALLLQERRGEVVLETGVDRPDSSTVAELGPLLEAATSALRDMDAGRHSAVIRTLAPFYNGEPTLEQGEIAYLIALNYYKKRSRVDYEHARSLLEAWIRRREEGELWYRLMLTLAVVHASLGDQRASSETLTRVRVYLERASERDSGARAKIHVLNRKADVFYPLEVAGTLIEKAVDYFAPPSGAELPRNAFQYSAALINLSGNMYTRGEFDKAFDFADVAIRFISAFSSRMRLPEPYKAFNNYAIAAIRGNRLECAEVLEIMNSVAAAIEGSDRLDHSLLTINRGVINVLSGRLTAADQLFGRSYAGIKTDAVEGYYLVFAASNYAASQYLLGDSDRALALLDEVEGCLWELPSELRCQFELRQQCLRKAIHEGLARRPDEWDSYPKLLQGDDGPHVSWRSLGYGLIMSDIQVWSES